MIVVTLPMIRSEHAGLFTYFRDFAELGEATRDGALPTARSRFVQVGQMWSCDALFSTAALEAETQVRTRVARACLARAEAILDSVPTMSAAHQARAVALYTLGDTEEAIYAKALSRITGPNEGGLALRRLGFAYQLAEERPFNHGDEADAILILGSAGYRDYLVDYFLYHPDHRDWLVALLQDQSGNADFLQSLRDRLAEDAMQG
ncbi:MAG: hypothetical protein EBU35_13480 [Marivivens sp.]|nr:hypothetical protein [Marivivens sp.]